MPLKEAIDSAIRIPSHAQVEMPTAPPHFPLLPRHFDAKSPSSPPAISAIMTPDDACEQPVLGLFESGHMMFEYDRGVEQEDEPSLR